MPNTEPSSQLADAIRADDVARTSDILATHPKLATKLNEPIPGGSFGSLAIGVAVEKNNLAMLDLLLAHGADINARTRWWAGGFGILETCDADLAPALIQRGATVDAHAAARLGMLAMLNTLVGANPKVVHSRAGDGKTPLHYASSVEIARCLLDHGADIDALDVDHESTPAQYLVREHTDVARFLVTRGCRSDILMASALGARELVLRHLDADPSSVGTRVNSTFFPMRNAHAGGTIYIWTLRGNKTAHIIAREFGHDDIFQLLMDRSPASLKLVVACAIGDETLVSALVTEQPNLVTTLSTEELRQLPESAFSGDQRAVRLMLQAGWPVDTPNDTNATALHCASWHGDVAMVRELIARGASPHVRESRFGGTPIGWAEHGAVNSWRRSEGDYAGVMESLRVASASRA